MADREYKLRISVGVDRSAAAAIQQLGDVGGRVRKRIKTDLEAAAKEGGDALEKAAKTTADRVVKQHERIGMSAQKLERALGVAAANTAKSESVAAGRSFDERLKMSQRAHAAFERDMQRQVRLHRQEQAEVERKERAEARAQARREAASDRAAKREAERAGRERTALAKGIASDAFGNMAGAAGKAFGLAKTFASGSGINFDLGSMLGKRAERETLATQISNAAYQEGGKRESIPGLLKTSEDIASKYAMDPSKVLEGLAAYQAKTGDLPTAKAGLEDLAKLAKSSGTDIANMIDAAADVGTALGDVGKDFATAEEKAAAVYRVMKVIAAQGQLGAVEIKDLAAQMAKLSAASTSFGGDKEKNVEKMGALVQLARQMGGASSSTQAATSVAGFVNTLKTKQRIKEFDKYGVETYDKEGKIIDPFKIMVESLKKTGGDPMKMKDMWKNVVGSKPVEAISTIYKDAEAKKKGSGEQAAYDKLAEFMKPMSEGQINSNVATAMETTQSKAQLFQNQLQKIADSMAERVLPQLEKLGPKVLEVVEALSKIVGFAAENPGQAIVMAITGSIAKAAIGNVLQESIAGLLKKAMTGGAGGAMGALGGAGAVLGTLAIATAAFEIGTATIDILADASRKGQNERQELEAQVINAIGDAKAALDPKRNPNMDPERQKAVLTELMKVREKQAGRIASAEDPTNWVEAIFTNKTFAQRTRENEDAAHLDQLKDDLAKVDASIKALQKGIPVTVVNMPPGGPNAPGNGRQGIQ